MTDDRPELNIPNPRVQRRMAPPPPPPPSPPEPPRSAKGSRRGGVFPSLVMIVTIGGLGVLGWYAYDAGKHPLDLAEVPVVHAKEGPFKIKPQHPGGMEILNTDKSVFDVISEDQPKQEVAQVRPVAEEPVERAPISITPKAISDSDKTAEEKAPEVKRLPIEPAAGGEEAQEKPAEKVAEEKPAVEAPKTVVKPKAAAKPAASGGYKVQLGAYRTMDSLKAGWTKLQKRFPKLLKGLDYSVERANLGAKGIFYRLQAGPIKGKSAARSLCKKLGERKQGCIVVGK